MNKERNKLVWLLWACRAVVLAAAGFSIWANVLHAKPGTVPVLFAAAPPLIVIGAWELVSRIPILKDRPWYRRWVRPIVTFGLAAGAAYLSYRHQRSAVLRYTEDWQAATILPGLIDGLMIIASVSVFELNDRIAELEAAATGLAIRLPKSEPKPATILKKKELVAQLLSKHPDWTIKQIAKTANASEGYTANLVGELRKLDGAELISVE